MPDIYAAAARHRQALIRQDTEAAHRMLLAYESVKKSLKADLKRLQETIAEAQASGETVNRAWLKREVRYQTLLQQAEEQIGTFATFAAQEITTQQRIAVESAQRNAVAEVEVVMPVVMWNRIPTEALADLVGFLGDGSPLADRLKELAPKTSDEIATALIRGLAIGKAPNAIARDIQAVSDLVPTQARTIARTEVLRSYRESSRRSYEANPSVVIGWRWLAGLGSRCCAMCAALHGQVFPVEEPMGTHPCCRCTTVPILRGINQEPSQTGEEWLNDQVDSVQDAVLGSKAAGDAYRAGQVKLRDFVGKRKDDKWGLTRYALSLKKAMEKGGY